MSQLYIPSPAILASPAMWHFSINFPSSLANLWHRTILGHIVNKYFQYRQNKEAAQVTGKSNKGKYNLRGASMKGMQLFLFSEQNIRQKSGQYVVKL
jgi:hypothetical protein